MAVCNPCIKTKPLPNCLAQLVIGSTALVSQSVKVYIEDLATGVFVVLTGAADGDGIVTVSLADAPGFFSNHPYELWITDIGGNITDTQDITIGGATSETVCMRFVDVRGEDGTVETFLTQTITEA